MFPISFFLCYNLVMAVFSLFPAVCDRNSVPKKISGIDSSQFSFFVSEKNAPFADFHMSRDSPLRGLERNGIPRKNVFLKSSECFSLSFNGFERISKSCFFRLMLPSKISSFFLFCKLFRNEITKFRMVHSSAEWVGTEFWAFSIPRNRQNSDGINQNFRLSVCFVFHGIIFFSENGHPTLEHVCLF